MPTLPVSHPGYILATEHNNLLTLICFKGFIFGGSLSRCFFVSMHARTDTRDVRCEFLYHNKRVIFIMICTCGPEVFTIKIFDKQQQHFNM